MKRLLNLLVVVLMLGIGVVAPSPPSTNAQTPTPTATSLDSDLEQALTLLGQTPSGERLATLVLSFHENGGTVAFASLPEGILGSFSGDGIDLLTGRASGQLLINQNVRGTAVAASTIAHEAVHLVDRLWAGPVLNTQLGCNFTELNALIHEVDVWTELKGMGVSGTEDTSQLPKSQELNALILPVQIVKNLSPSNPIEQLQLGLIVGHIQRNYQDSCSSRVSALFIVPAGSSSAPSQSSPSADTSGSSSSTTTPPASTPTTEDTSNSSTNTAESSSASTPSSVVAGVSTVQANNPSGDGSSGDLSDVPSSLPKSGGIPVDGSGIAVVAALLTGAGIGLKRVVGR